LNLLPFAGWAAPLVAITSPAAASVFEVARTVEIAGTCSPGVSLVELYYDGAIIGSTVPVGGNWSFRWSPGLLRAAGAKNMVARAVRGLRESDSAPRSFTVDNVPLRSIYGSGGGCWFADDLAFANNATVTSWSSRVNGLTWTSSTATMLTGGWVDPRGSQKCVSIRVAANGEMNCDALAPLFQGTNPPVTVMLIMQVPTGLGTGTQMLFTATSTSSSGPKWLYEHVGLAQRLAKATTTLTFSTTKNLAIDFGQHMYVATDTGTVMNVWRDSGCVMNADAPQPLDVANAAINTVNLGVQNNAGSKVFRADMNLRGVVVAPTASISQSDFQYVLNFYMGNFDHDQYFGDAATPFELDIFVGQSNTQGLAVSTLPAVDDIRFFFRSNNNWLSDPTALAALEPQGSGPFIGYWYQSAVARKAALAGGELQVCGFGSGAQFCSYYSTFADDGYYSTSGFDAWCRNLETAKALYGGTPSYRLIWGQGESDTQNSTAASVYLSNLTTVMAMYESRLGVGFPLVVIEVNGTSPGQPFAAQVQADQATFAAGRAHTVLDTSSQVYVFPTGFISSLHFNQASMIAIGNSVGNQVVS
jgi:hypothetical protein